MPEGNPAGYSPEEIAQNVIDASPATPEELLAILQEHSWELAPASGGGEESALDVGEKPEAEEESPEGPPMEETPEDSDDESPVKSKPRATGYMAELRISSAKKGMKNPRKEDDSHGY